MEDLLRCAQVCRAWQEVLHEPSLWHTLKLSPIAERANDKLAELVVHRYSPFICHIDGANCVKITNAGLAQLGECKNLQKVNLGGCVRISVSCMIVVFIVVLCYICVSVVFVCVCDYVVCVYDVCV